MRWVVSEKAGKSREKAGKERRKSEPWFPKDVLVDTLQDSGDFGSEQLDRNRIADDELHFAVVEVIAGYRTFDVRVRHHQFET